MESPLSLSAVAAHALDGVVQTMQQQIDELSAEINLLRRRDETLNFHLHRMDEELRLAARLQQDFLPKSLPQVGRVKFHSLFRPAGYVSGDLYDVMRLDEKHVGFYMADAVGHGMPAALLTMFIKTALLTKEINPDGYKLIDPSSVIAHLNDTLVGQQLSYATFATAIYGLINTETLEVKLARGGHPNPVLLRADGEVVNIETDGSLLGIFPEEQFPQTSFTLSPGDRLFIFTDGVELAFSDGGKGIDATRWRQELCTRKDLDTEQLLHDFSARMDEDAGSLLPKDDLTIIVVEAEK